MLSKKYGFYYFVFCVTALGILSCLIFLQEIRFAILLGVFLICDFILKIKLLKNNKELQCMFDFIPEIVFMKDIKGGKIIGNRKYKKILKNNDDFNEGDFDKLKGNHKRTFEFEEKIKTPNKEEWYKISKIPIINTNKKKVDRIAFFCRNIEKEKSLETQKGNFVASLVHDLKNPIFAQIRILDLLLNNKFGHLSDVQKEVLIELKNSNKNAADIISNVLDTYKHSEGKMEFCMQDIDLSKLIKETCAELSYLLEDEDVLVFDEPRELIEISGDIVHIRRVLSNIISNAIKHRNNGSKIQVDLQLNDNFVEFRVSNNGKHITSKEMNSLFERYVSKTNKFKHISTGLGLFLSKQIIQEHSGEMIATSTIDGINTFGFKVPSKEFLEKYREQTA